MNDFLHNLGWGLIVVEFLIVIYWVKQFSIMKWKLFFGIKKDLLTTQHHELHSCFLSAFCFLIFHLIGSEAEHYLLSLEMQRMAHIELFYTSMAIVQFMFGLTLFCLHLVRGCTFSPTARICMYTTLVMIMLHGMQLIARRYFDYHELNMVYILIGWTCNFIAISALATYPVRSIKDYFKQKRAAAS
ncbi:hypothetical protein PSECIP111854_00315 [Pseudoalteromonas sp. CIP111854]|uniref:Uncharacterized protein n=1 Tax=Pseudoalteromonas holothuriae TaxID=2963714 RepID=A0A9W4QR65_9GAMM|nr:hypothetical protein [Pseudoalteromonas sp. CIP111854]CAH9049668.1 hypothetical protein PSECIP111854_00315 [Pseudoalteromonas sp. CIP111854]